MSKEEFIEKLKYTKLERKLRAAEAIGALEICACETPNKAEELYEVFQKNLADGSITEEEAHEAVNKRIVEHIQKGINRGVTHL